MKKVFLLLFSIALLFVNSFDSYAIEYDIDEKTGLGIQDIEKQVERLIDSKENMSSNSKSDRFKIESYDISASYVVSPITDYCFIKEHRNGKNIVDMATADYQRFLLPVKNILGNSGMVTYKLNGKIMTYLGMSASTQKKRMGLDIGRIKELCANKVSEKSELKIYINDLYHLYIANIIDGNMSYIIVAPEAELSNKGSIKYYELYSEDDFWNEMEKTYDEDALDPEVDADGVPYRTNNIADNAYSTHDANSLIVWVALSIALFISTVYFGILLINRKKQIHQ